MSIVEHVGQFFGCLCLRRDFDDASLFEDILAEHLLKVLSFYFVVHHLFLDTTELFNLLVVDGHEEVAEREIVDHDVLQ